MEQVAMTASHWMFLSIIVAIFVFIGFRKGIIIPSVLGIFALGLLAEPTHEGGVNQVIFACQIVFRALLNAGVELFDIMLVIALMVSMLKSLKAQGADAIMVAPMKRLMVTPWTTFFVLGITMYVASAFFWPTPAVALIGTVLIPVAMQVGLPAVGAAISVNLFGHGMALSADPVIQGASRLTASAAGIGNNELVPYTLLFSFVVGAIAVAISVYTLRRDMRRGLISAPKPEEMEILNAERGAENVSPGPYAKWLAAIVPLVLLSIACLMIYRALFLPEQAIRGGSATALLGGAAAVLLVISSVAAHGTKAFDGIGEHTREGFMFAIKIFSPIIPIAAFFLLGHPDHAASVLGNGAPGFLFDIGTNMGQYINGNPVILTFGIAMIGVMTGLDGSGFSGLPLVGSLAGALGIASGYDVAVLAALGQVTAIFAGGGTLVAWAFGAAADAGVAGVKPAELVRRNFIPVITGIVSCTLLATLLIM